MDGRKGRCQVVMMENPAIPKTAASLLARLTGEY
jgi:hypothetical protein